MATEESRFTAKLRELGFKEVDYKKYARELRIPIGRSLPDLRRRVIENMFPSRLKSEVVFWWTGGCPEIEHTYAVDDKDRFFEYNLKIFDLSSYGFRDMLKGQFVH